MRKYIILIDNFMFVLVTQKKGRVMFSKTWVKFQGKKMYTRKSIMKNKICLQIKISNKIDQFT